MKTWPMPEMKPVYDVFAQQAPPLGNQIVDAVQLCV
jgi:hypothetical protein